MSRDHDDRAVVAPARPGDGGARQGLECGRRPPRRRPSASAASVGDEDGLRALVVLGLGQQVDGDVARVVGGVGHDRPPRTARRCCRCRHGRTPAAWLRRRRRCRDRRCGRPAAMRGGAVGQRGHRLCAADAVDLGHAGAAGGGQHQRVRAGRPAPARTSRCGRRRRRGRAARSSARRTGRPPCRRARRGRPRRAGSSACRAGARPRRCCSRSAGSWARWNASIRRGGEVEGRVQRRRDRGAAASISPAVTRRVGVRRERGRSGLV